jgi:hypothetical protein
MSNRALSLPVEPAPIDASPDVASERVVQLHRLREEVARRHAQWREADAGARCPTGVAEVDRLLSGGFPKGQVSVLGGPLGAGASSLVARAMARVTAEGGCCAWVVGPEGLNAAALRELGVELPRLLVVRAPPAEASWAATQLARSGGLALVAVDVPARGWSAGELHRLGDATRAGRVALVLVSRGGAAVAGSVKARLEASGRQSPAGGGAERRVRLWVERSRAGGEASTELVGGSGRRPSWRPWRPDLEAVGRMGARRAWPAGDLPSFVLGRRLHGRSQRRSRGAGGRP